MFINKSADSRIIRDIEEMFEMVELEVTLLKTEYIPKGNKHVKKHQEKEHELTKFRADKYRWWIYKMAPKYAEAHPYLHFQFARIVGLSDESVVQVMTRLRKDFEKVSVAERAGYAVEAKEVISQFMVQKLSKKALH